MRRDGKNIVYVKVSQDFTSTRTSCWVSDLLVFKPKQQSQVRPGRSRRGCYVCRCVCDLPSRRLSVPRTASRRRETLISDDPVRPPTRRPIVPLEFLRFCCGVA